MPTAPRNATALTSVGVKLASATILVIAVVAGAAFMVLSHHERSSLLGAKENAALMVARLYSDSLSAPVLFGDEGGVKDVIANLARNDEIIYAAVWPVDAAAPSGLGPALAELRRGATGILPPVEARSSLRTEVTAEWVLVETGVVDPRGKLVGMAQAAFSLARENGAIHTIERRLLLLSIGGALLLSFALLLLARRIIVRPLARLATAAKSLEMGQPASIDVGANDEIGGLAQALSAMSAAIENREQRLGAKNRDMRLVLDNVEEGFIMLDPRAGMSAERSRILDAWFGPPPADASFASYLAAIDDQLAGWFRLGWDAVIEDLLPLELTIEQLPKGFRHVGRSYTLRYRPILDGARLASVLVVINDVTERIEHERADRAMREMMTIFRHMMRSRVSFGVFHDEVKALMSAIELAPPDDEVLLRRLVHTLKGNCAQFGVESVAAACHDIETRMGETGESITASEKSKLRELWAAVVEPCVQLAPADGERIDLDETEYARFLEAVRARTEHRALAAMMASWKHEPAGGRLDRIAEQMRATAAQLGLAPLEVECRPTALRLPQRAWGPFWSAFAHVVRNTVDHGVGPADERAAAGRPAGGRIVLAVEARGAEVMVSIADDGPGIAWDKLAAKAEARGMPTGTRADLVEALFTDGISSRDEVTAISGRGVGMGAVRAVVRELGGRIELEEERGRGTTFRFFLPRTMLGERWSTPPVAFARTDVAN